MAGVQCDQLANTEYAAGYTVGYVGTLWGMWVHCRVHGYSMGYVGTLWITSTEKDMGRVRKLVNLTNKSAFIFAQDKDPKSG